MPINSLSFVLFFGVFFLLYWRVFNRSLISQNWFILVGSYLFYAWWDWRFLLLLIGSSMLNYWLGIRLQRTKDERQGQVWLWLGLIEGVGLLFFFKMRGMLPLGISFYTFRTMSYLMDIRRNRIQATTDWIAFFDYVAFFPCMTAGPIDRAGTLIPQIQSERTFDYDMVTDGMRQIVWGVFKKLVIADRCVVFTTTLFDQYKAMPGSSLLIGAVLFSVQLYADFSGYSDIAIGLASMLGFRVTRNFHYPFFSQGIVDYWRRWHMSLTTWLTDYVFTPLAFTFRDYGKVGIIAAVIITFAANGIWHGANWTYLVYGCLNGCLFIPAIVWGRLNKRRTTTDEGKFSMIVLLRRIGTFMLVTLLLIVFRADNLTQAMGYWHRIFSVSVFARPVRVERWYQIISLLLLIPGMFLVEWRQRDKRHALEIDHIRRPAVRTAIYLVMIGLILGFSASSSKEFIYFKF